MSEDSAGRYGETATVEVDPGSVGRIRLAYSPHTDGAADPGEIVWTWVPYEERDGRGKDRPVLVVATAPGGALLGVALTSKPHDDRWDVAIGSGPWDSAGRPSWVRLERVFRLQQGGIRRAGVGLDEARYGTVAAALAARYGWPAPTSVKQARTPAPTRTPAPPRGGRAASASRTGGVRATVVRALRRFFG
ncbi:type II toxin-antitoxin system PemK/MazF family toxin [Herbiconiux sp. VKM Ac-2851]|uniref:type II toxin-antitoxin system PemK/MazF family toxin n=1 Tax=Herbiconiux sp. VKM Ac-2851 TaxID=2739025 RepID=UPI001566DD0F|nr:type II toxin-antitoxin system PemK/MazF family toxin [Herbiconiux sp. VKM Ac-2851]